MLNVVAIIVTHNPDLNRFRLVLNSLIGEVDSIVIVDNASQNINSIMELCTQISNCEVVRLQFNSGVAYALMKGVNYAVKKYKPDWLLFLDDDTIIMRNAVKKALSIYRSLPKLIKDKVGLIKFRSEDGDCNIYNTFYEAFSGTLIKSEIAMKTCCRTDFFLDQADNDLYFKVRKMGLLTLQIKCRLIDHRLGIKVYMPLLRRIVSYEPPWRYYYIVRNSTILLREGALDPVNYLLQLINYGLLILLRDNIKGFLKPLGLGFMHALLNQSGYLDKKYFS